MNKSENEDLNRMHQDKDKISLEGEPHYRQIFEKGGLGIVLVKKNFYFIQANAAFCSMIGYSERELASLKFNDITHPDHVAGDKENVIKLIKGEIPVYNTEKRYICKDGSIVWGAATITAIIDKNGEFMHFLAMILDITARKRAEKELIQTTERLALATSADLLGVWDWNLKDNSMVWDDRMFELYGITSDTFSNTIDAWTNGLHPDDKQRALEECNAALAGTKDFRTTFRVLRPDGTVIHVKADALVIRDSAGKAMRMVGINSDITQRKHTEMALNASEEKYRSIFENVQDVFYEASIDGIILEISSSIKIVSRGQYERNDLIGKSLSSFYKNPRERDALVNRLIEMGNVVDYVIEFTNKDGSIMPCSISAKLCFDMQDKPYKIIGSMRDITERKKMEYELQKAQKLDSLGVLAGGIAHDFNNLLCGIFGYIDMAIAGTNEPKVSSYLAKAANTINRARALTQQLLTFAKGGAPIRKIEALFPFIQETTKFVLSGSTVSSSFQIQEKLWPCDIDKNQIGQVIDNLIINSLQAMPNGGNIEISAQNISLTENQINTLASGNYVKLSIKDQGIGIPNDFLSRIFDPFYTTKSKGHGLGLSTCYSIISRHGGLIDVESEPGKGSTFHVYLPASADSVSAAAIESTTVFRGSGTFLVMDDEEIMREAIGDMLKSLGYSVILKGNGEDAVAWFAEEIRAKRSLAGMIFDLTIPGGMGGREAIGEIRKLCLKTPVFVASGYADDPVMANPRAYGFTASMRKPFRKAELEKILSASMTTQQN